MKKTLLAVIAFCLLSFYACNNSPEVESTDTTEMHQGTPEEVEHIVEQFIMVEKGGTINLPAGFYEFNTQLILDNIDSVSIIGAGMGETILSFKSLKTGGEGVKIVGNNVLLQDFSVYDAPGDGVKAQHCENLTMRRVNATWTNGDKSKNGTYALYPVQCKNVMIDACVASHSRDAGIYVGQSENIIVKNCSAYGNVAGIEIENCDNAEVFDCKAYNNTGGILVFNLPGLNKADAYGTRIYNNEIYDNNHENFANTGEGNNGNPITQIPPGTGVVLFAAKGVEVFNNKIIDNKTTGVVIASFHITQLPFETSNGWSPFTRDIYVHDNEYKRPAAMPDMTKELGQLLSMKNAWGPMKSQDIVYDGIVDAEDQYTVKNNPMNVCIKEPQIADLHFTYFVLSEKISDIEAFKEYSFFECEHPVVTDVSSIANL